MTDLRETSATESALPAGWSRVSLGELGTWTGGGTPKKGNPAYWKGEVPWVSPKDMKRVRLVDTQDHISEAAIEESAAKSFPPNSIALVVRSGILEHTLPVALVPFRATANQDMKVLTPSPGVNVEWLLHALLGAAPDIRERCRKHGTTVASIDFPKLKEYRLALPPEAEQTRIVTAVHLGMDAVAGGEASIRDAERKLGDLRRSVLLSALSGRLVAQDPNDEPASFLLERIGAEDLASDGNPTPKDV